MRKFRTAAVTASAPLVSALAPLASTFVLPLAALALLASALALLTSCDPTVHQYPEPLEARVLLVPHFDLKPYTAYKCVSFDERWTPTVTRLDDHEIEDAPLDGETSLRLTMDVCRGTLEEAARADWQSAVEERIVRQYDNRTAQFADTIATTLADGRYHAVAWADYCPELWDVTALSDAHLCLGAFPRQAGRQQAVSGREEWAIDFQLGPEGYPQWRGQTARDRIIPVELRRTQGRVRIEAIDLADYEAANGPATAITVRAVFTMFVSTGMNAFSDMPSHYVTTYTLASPARRGEAEDADGTLPLLTHYILTRPEGETVVQADFYLYAADGRLVNHCEGLQIPVRRGGETMVRGHFLTPHEQNHGGMGVDENFDGEYVVPFTW